MHSSQSVEISEGYISPRIISERKHLNYHANIVIGKTQVWIYYLPHGDKGGEGGKEGESSDIIRSSLRKILK